ncbi:hypothetical protein TPA0910_54340 [Streptomyces hygroscopicus subsp. sporocinereus]|uniref:Uncharacterized protein n=1 Tax=Streptomyces hygroscopicus TaxID=1912 RepID=A0ABQ3U5X4_STRHY|nr:hypothetical protein TPA0910_54340 [Streptomyces hygroscopicus]
MSPGGVGQHVQPQAPRYGHVRDLVQLFGHNLRATDAASQHGFVEERPHDRMRRPVQNPGPFRSDDDGTH